MPSFYWAVAPDSFGIGLLFPSKQTLLRDSAHVTNAFRTIRHTASLEDQNWVMHFWCKSLHFSLLSSLVYLAWNSCRNLPRALCNPGHRQAESHSWWMQSSLWQRKKFWPQDLQGFHLLTGFWEHMMFLKLWCLDSTSKGLCPRDLTLSLQPQV